MQGTGSHVVTQQEPTLAEFEAARKSELARLNARLFSLTGKGFHTSEDLALLEGDTLEREQLDRETGRLWSNGSKKLTEGKKAT